jgi:hypothetical protein
MKNEKKENGSIFLDVLLGLFTASVVLIIIFGSLAHAASLTAKNQKRVLEMIEKRNETAKTIQIQYKEEKE